MDLEFTPEENAFRDEVRAFLAANLPARLSAKVTQGKLLARADMVEWHAILNRQGWLASHWPVEYGGTGWSATQKFIFDNECALAGAPRIVPFGLSMLGPVLIKYGNEAQKRHWLPRILDGSDWWCQGYSEPGAGSDLASVKTTAVRDGDHYVLNGEKCFITNAPLAGLFTVMARTDPHAPGAKGITAFIVERGTPGLTTGQPYDKMGQAGSPVSAVHLQDCRVPAANIIGGQEGLGFKTAMKVLNKQRIHLAALCIGPAIRMLDDTLRFVAERQQFGKPLMDFQLIQAMLADCQTEIQAARALVLQTARERDAGVDVTLNASICKYFASEMCGRVADRCVQMHGGYGYIADYGIERFYRDVRLFRLYEGTSQIHQLTIARHTLTQAGYTPGR